MYVQNEKLKGKIRFKIYEAYQLDRLRDTVIFFFFISIAIDLLLFIYPGIRNKGRNIVDSNFNPRILHPLGTVIAGWFRAYTRMHALSNSMNVDNWLVSVSMGE